MYTFSFQELIKPSGAAQISLPLFHRNEHVLLISKFHTFPREE